MAWHQPKGGVLPCAAPTSTDCAATARPAGQGAGAEILLGLDQFGKVGGVGAGQDQRQHARLGHQGHGGGGIGGGQKLAHLVPDAFARNLRKARAQFMAGGKGLHVGLAAIPGQKAEKAQDAQVILGDAGAGIADKAQLARGKVGKPADRV